MLNAKGKVGAKFVVFELGVDSQASQLHKIKLKLTPYKDKEATEAAEKSNLRVINHQRTKLIRQEIKKLNNTVRDEQKLKVATLKDRAVK